MNLKLDSGVLNGCGITMNDSEQARVIAEVMRTKPGVRVSEEPALINIDADRNLVFNMAELSEAMGSDFDVYQFQIEVTAYYGRMVVQDDQVILFANQEEAMKYYKG
ncbi:MmoB/DmpM family protein [Kyrpidia tusciae]|uniref:Monooxygenase component MmoB/DmpM n=1 Tax=Kyrpidia tusciae (strain DSM 2912 / NBRC 15312 / T2) TaxID=562970 RepID=D5WPK5_KYRT2|nr:MmoB/DmpM family protein [Kyrpidia tusciae]ADG06264.1 monooxygenase component MmoB/DmpM [Kyrpidia tusciae DSM 2912]